MNDALTKGDIKWGEFSTFPIWIRINLSVALTKTFYIAAEG